MPSRAEPGTTNGPAGTGPAGTGSAGTGSAGTGLAGLIGTVADRTLGCAFRMWGFGEGPALLGLLEAGDLLARAELVDAVADLVAPTLGRPPDPTDHLIPVEVLLRLRQLRPELDSAGAVRRWVAAVLGAARPVPGHPPVHRPDLPGLRTLIWVDCMHTDGPGLALAGHPDAAAGALDEAAGALQDGTGLFSHGFDVATGRPNRVHWGRGQGWALHGLVGAQQFGATGDALRSRTAALLAGLAAQELDGAWRTIVDDPAAQVEHSVAALVASGLLAGIDAEVLGPGWQPMAERALAATIAAVAADGGLTVSSATPVGDAGTYLDRDHGVFPWGQGPLLLALVRQYRREPRWAPASFAPRYSPPRRHQQSPRRRE